MLTNDLVVYKILPMWQASTIPNSFKKPHNTQIGTWAKLHIYQGSLDFAFCDENGANQSETYHFDTTNQPPFIEPQSWHRILSVSDDIKCQLTFYCREEHYVAKKYQLSNTHSEVINALNYIKPCKTLDLGCGRGRNAIYLARKGFEVEALDINRDNIYGLHDIVEQEQLTNLYPQIADFNNLDKFSIKRKYDFILSTVVLMFLQPNAANYLLEQMQNATNLGGYNLIVSAMDTDDFPCVMPFPFTLKPNQLKNIYTKWKIIK